MELNICHLYPDILNLYGDRGNILSMQKRLEWRGIGVTVTGVSIGQALEASAYDLLFVGGGQDFEQEVLLGDLAGAKTKDLKSAIEDGLPVLAICGGYQMLGQSLSDPEGVEDGGSMKGLGLLPVTTTFTTEKTRTRVNGTLLHVEGNLKALENLKFEGYEIHMGKTELLEGCPMNQIHDTVKKKDRQIPDMEPENRIENSTDGISHGNVYGTYIHGIFDKEKIVSEIVKSLAEKKGLSMEEVEGVDLKAFKECQYDLLADTLRKHLDMKAIYQIMGMQK